MTALVDTSALHALLDEDDDHGAAVTTWTHLLGAERLVTHAYVVSGRPAGGPRRAITASPGSAARTGRPGLRCAAAARSVQRMDTAELLALRTDQRAALLLLGLRGDW